MARSNELMNLGQLAHLEDNRQRLELITDAEMKPWAGGGDAGSQGARLSTHTHVCLFMAPLNSAPLLLFNVLHVIG